MWFYCLVLTGGLLVQMYLNNLIDLVFAGYKDYFFMKMYHWQISSYTITLISNVFDRTFFIYIRLRSYSLLVSPRTEKPAKFNAIYLKIQKLNNGFVTAGRTRAGFRHVEVHPTLEYQKKMTRHMWWATLL